MSTHLRGAIPLLATALALANAPDAIAQVAPSLGVVQQFSVLGGSGVTGSAGAGTTVTGDVGSYPTCNVTNFPPSTVAGGGFILHGPVVCDGTVQTARADATAAFIALNQGPGTVIAAQMAATTRTSGIYTFALGAADIAANGTLTLDGPGNFVFITASTLTANLNSNVSFTNGANPCNVFWQVGSSATLNGATFGGQVFASASVSVGGGNVTGRAIAGSGAVTMASGPNTIGGCATAGPVVPPPLPGPVPALPDVAAAGLLALLLVSGVLLARR